MLKMISLRNVRVPSTTGHVVLFEAKVPRDVPDEIVSEAMALGCVPVDEADIPFHEDLSRAKVEFQGDVRKSMIYLAVQLLAEENNVKKFDGGGTPKTSVVADMLGYEVGRQEVLDTFRQYQTVRAEGIEYKLHPAAPNILRVLQAETKDELVGLADEFGVDEKKAKGLVVRDLRKLLLVKFSGIAAG